MTISYLHTGFTVRDIDRSRAFYSGLLGLKELRRPDHDFQGSWYEIGSAQLHLFTAPAAAEPDRENGDFELRAPHVALAVEGWEALVEKLKSAGVAVKLQDSTDGLRRAFIQDPDGNMLELVDRASPA